MKASFRIEGGLLRLRREGPFDVDAYLALLADVIAHADYRPGMPLIMEAGESHGPFAVVDFDRVREALNRPPLRAFRPKRYAIVARDLHYEAIVKLTNVLVTEGLDFDGPPTEVRHFTSVAFAETWARGG
jgi:hypothetical protein